MKELFTKHNKIQTDSELAKVLLKICKMLHIKH